MKSRAILWHASVAAGFGALAAAWSFPLVLHVSTHLPGRSLGDNALFLWNFWWMRTARASGADFFQTPFLFAPAGANLALHTHSALPAFVGATVLGRFSTIAALNLTTIASLGLNGFCAYLLAWRMLRRRGAAVVAGVIFATSPYIAAHLDGHFNLIAAWTIPLFALSVEETLGGSLAWAVFGGVVLAATAYVDYYYVVYEIAFACVTAIFLARRWSIDVAKRSARRGWPMALAAIAMAVSLVAVVALRTFNALQLFWILVVVAILTYLRPLVSAPPSAAWSFRRAALGVAAMAAVFAVIATPLLAHAIDLIWRGEYITQRYFWRSSPVGVDAGTLVLGNPFNSLLRAPLQHLYAALGIDMVESGAWLGIAPVILAVGAVRRHRADADVRRWVVIGAVFFVWALGSHVHVLGANTGFITPEALLRYLPIVANARMPGRALVVVYLAMAMLAARALAGRRASMLALSVALAIILADFWIAPLPLTPIDCAPIYTVLRDRPERGTLVELPLGLVDGLGEITPADHRMMTCQLIHERPIVGGVVARLPANVLAAYRGDPLIATWLRLSGASASAIPAGEPPDADRAASLMEKDGIAFVLLNRRTASAALTRYVEQTLRLDRIAADEERSLYVRRGL